MSRTLAFILLLPRNIIVSLLRLYRLIISPLYGDVCRYYPSCSHFALESIQRHGVILGGVRALLRLIRCHPWAAGGVDDVKPSTHTWFVITRAGWVLPRFDSQGDVLSLQRIPHEPHIGRQISLPTYTSVPNMSRKD